MGGSAGRIALGTWIAAALLCGVASAVILEATPLVATNGGGAVTVPTTPSSPAPTLGGAVVTAGPTTVETGADPTTSTSGDRTPSVLDPDLTGGVHLEHAGTWVLAADGSAGALLATDEGAGQLEWAAADVLARAAPEGIVVVGLDGSQRTVTVPGGRRLTSAGFGGGLVVFGWTEPAGGRAGTSLADLDLAGEQLLVSGQLASTAAVAPTGDSFVVTADGVRTFDAAGRRRAGPAALGASLRTTARWDHTGSWLVVEVGDDVELVRPDLGDRRPVSAPGHVPGRLAVEPGGGAVAFEAAVDAEGGTAVFVALPDGRDPTLLAEPGRDPAWHPNGDLVAYAVHPSPDLGFPASEVRAVGPDGSGTVRLASLAEGLLPDNLRWSPDGNWLALDVRRAH